MNVSLRQRLPAASPAWVLVCVCFGYALVIVDTTAVNVALPAIGADLGASVGALQWAIDGYVLVFASLLILGGSLGDRIGTAVIFRVGVAVFTAASAACGVSTTVVMLVVARLCQGIGAALLAPACLALIAAAYPDPGVRRRAVAVFVTAAGSPQAFGPLLGGALVGWVGWRSIFFVNVPLGVATLVMATLRRMPSATSVAAGRIPWLGHVAVLVLMASGTVMIIEIPSTGSGTTVFGAAVCFVGAAACLVGHQRRSRDPALSRVVLHSRAAVGFVGLGAVVFAAYYGFVFALTLFLQQRVGLSPVATGVVFLAAAIPIFALPLLSRPIVDRVGARSAVVLGVVFGVVGALVFGCGVAADPIGRAVGLLLFGCGVGLVVSPQVVLVLDSVPASVSGQASALLNAGRQLGTVVGVAVLGAVGAGGLGIRGAGALAAALLGGTALTLVASGRRRNAVALRQVRRQ